MGIRIEHSASPAAVGMAAFATGRGKARQRQQKYSFDLARDQQRIQSRQQGLKYRAVAGGRQRLQQNPFGQQAAGVWEDPLAGATGQAAVQIRSQQEANARARRLGKPEPSPGADPIFTPAPTRDEIRRGQVLFDEDRERQQQLEDAAATRTVAGRKARATSLRSLMPDFDVDPAISGQLNQDLAEIEAALNGNQVDFNDPGQAAAVEEKIEAYKKTVAGLRPPDPNALGLVLDEETQRYRSPREGERATHIGGPGEFPQPIPEIAAQEEAKVAATAEAEKVAAEAAEKQGDRDMEAFGKAVDIYKKMYPDDALNLDSDKFKKIHERIQGIRGAPAAGGAQQVPDAAPWQRSDTGKIVREVPGQGFVEVPQEEQQQARDAAVNRELGPEGGGGSLGLPAFSLEEEFALENIQADQAAQAQAMQERPLPAGVPAGAKWIDENTVQLPDGRKIRRKGGR